MKTYEIRLSDSDSNLSLLPGRCPVTAPKPLTVAEAREAAQQAADEFSKSQLSVYAGRARQARDDAFDALIRAAKREAFEEAARLAMPDTDGGQHERDRLFADGRRSAAAEIRALSAKVTP